MCILDHEERKLGQHAKVYAAHREAIAIGRQYAPIICRNLPAEVKVEGNTIVVGWNQGFAFRASFSDKPERGLPAYGFEFLEGPTDRQPKFE
jgi:hypothetical protein